MNQFFKPYHHLVFFSLFGLFILLFSINRSANSENQYNYSKNTKSKNNNTYIGANTHILKIASTVRTQLCVILDSSGSIGDKNFKIMLDGVASTIDGRDQYGSFSQDRIVVPHNGSLELSMVIFSSKAFIVEFDVGERVVLNEDNFQNIAGQIRALPYSIGSTNMEDAFVKAQEVISGSLYYDNVTTRVVNLSTDGYHNTSTFEKAESERNKLVDILISGGNRGEIDVEAIGHSVNKSWLAGKITYPSTFSPTCNNIFNVGEVIDKHGFVLLVDSFDDFREAYYAKIRFVLSVSHPQRWKLINANLPPTSRYECSMAYDSKRKKIVLFGGHSGTAYGRLYDTWEYDEIGWTMRDTANDPNIHPVGSGPNCLAYDPDRQVCVYFGGYDGENYLNDTWEYSNAYWIKITTQNSPSKRYASCLVYDTERKKMVLFGGYGLSPTNPTQVIILNDTWEYNGQDWKEIITKTSPEPRCYHAMVYESIRKKIILFGGKTADNKVWEYDGINWQSINTENAPCERYGHSMAFDEFRKKILLYGGFNFGAYYDETWELNNYIWEKIISETSPEHPFAGSIIWNPDVKLLYYFGGRNTSDKVSDELWYYVDSTFGKGAFFVLH